MSEQDGEIDRLELEVRKARADTEVAMRLGATGEVLAGLHKVLDDKERQLRMLQNQRQERITIRQPVPWSGIPVLRPEYIAEYQIAELEEDMAEAQFQKKCRDIATRRGWLSYKLESPGQRGVPDCLFLYKGKTIYIEFKNPNRRGRLSELQKQKIKQLEKHGADVYVVDNEEVFIEILKLTESETE